MSLHPDICITPLHCAEFAHAVFLHVFWKKISLLEAQKASSAFDRDYAGGTWLAADFPEGIFHRSIDLARRYGAILGVRTLDSLHVACALELGAQKFWTFDERQAKLAEAVGLDTNP